MKELCPLDARRKLEVLPEFTESSEFRQLAVLFKRIKNISKEISKSEFLENENSGREALLLSEPAELALSDEIDRRRPTIEQAIETGVGYRQAFAEASAFAPAVDRFFSEVFVMVKDDQVRNSRLRLIKRLEYLIGQLADVSEIVPEEELPA